MRKTWRLPAAALAVGVAGALAVVASSHAAITITSLQARARTVHDHVRAERRRLRHPDRGEPSTDTNWESTSWSTGGVTRCVNHDDDTSNGSQTVDPRVRVREPTRRSKLLRARRGEPARSRQGRAQRARVPAAGRRHLAADRSSSSQRQLLPGTRLATRSISLTTKVPGANEPLTAACQGLKVAVVLDESGSIGNSAPQVRNATKALARGLVDTGARMAVFKFSTTASTELHRAVPDDHSGVHRRQHSTTTWTATGPAGPRTGTPAWTRFSTRQPQRPAGPGRLPHRRQPESLGRRRHRRTRRATTRR